MSADRPATRLATRLAFLAAGFGLACWAPLVPFAKQRLGVNDGALGALLLCVGLGSVASMLLTGPFSTRYGSKPIIVAGGVALAAILPLLTVASGPITLGVALFAFGAALGSLDVAMNVHAVEVERAAARPLMSGFHALFSVGGAAGSSIMTFLLSMRIGTFASTLLCAMPMLAAILFASPRLLQGAQAGERPRFVMPRGVVPLLALLAAITFLAEGALLDWSALLITDKGLVVAAQGGLGYVLFSIAMTAGRFGGDAIATRIGDRPTMFWGGLLAVAGFVILLTAPIAGVAMAGFAFIGLGASNIVPVLFRRAGAQRAMPSALAVTVITITGYGGHLVGPAGMGFVARSVGLESAFWMLAVLLCLVPCCARLVTGKR
ncbi:MFS transporter [Burkholderia sp. MSMB617WGS]|uniref:MFS transporter n=1 Tax=unclassified Burkholderia TaxID=2613784 RepID=UPI000531BEA0|nr:MULTISPECIES: MFS transporter [unclassified Burkholderia]AOK49882.1 MFS transporter [Burkholderia sp. MSMB617WGS]KGS04673.1 major Facilitator Superfamily protein [Burkholderia sp. ABCPW 111]